MSEINANFMPGDKVAGMEILLVEDQYAMALVIESAIRKVTSRFAGCAITVVAKLEDAKAIIARHAPDFIILDLTLSDSSMEETLKHVEDMEGKSPLLILTGHDVDRVKAEIPNLAVDIASKEMITSSRGFLFNLILDIRQRWMDKKRKQESEAMKSMLAEMRAITLELDANRT